MRTISGIFALGVLVISLLNGCASAPDVTLTYFLPKVSADVAVTETVTCTDRNEAILVSTVAVTPTYSRDDTKARQIRTALLDGPFSDVEVTFTLSPDRRLMGINSTQTGEGTAIVKSLVTLGSSIASDLKGANVVPVPRGTVATACQRVKSIGKDKGVAVSFFLKETFANDVVSEEVRPTSDSAGLFSIVKPLLGTLCLRGTRGPVAPATVTYNGSSGGVVMVPVIQPATYRLSLARLPPNGELQRCADPSAGQELWSAEQAVPQRGAEYGIPLPTAALFGTQSVVLALHDSNAITSLKYGKINGLASAADAATAIAGPFKQQTAVDRASEVKGDADLIAQQQRLAKCRTTPGSCT